MGFALVTAEIGDGRYTIELDLGEAQRLQLIDAANAAIAQYDLQLITAQANLATNEAFEAQLQVSVAETVQAIIDAQTADPSLGGVAAAAALAAYNVMYKQYMSVVARNRPLRRTILTLKAAIATAQKQYNTWFNFQALITKNAWCVDYTEGRAPGSYIATIEIEAEQDGPILLAEGARAWTAGDGTVLQSIKDANLATLAAQLALQEARKVTVEGKITTAEADEVALVAAYSNGVQEVIDAQATESQPAIELASYNLSLVSTRLNDKRADIRFLKATLATLNSSIAKINANIAIWTAKTGSANPVYGDGILKPREFMSPEQAFYNAAILPGVQKWRPTYRRGTLTAINRPANTGSVSLTDAYSEAQSLNINQAATLTGVEFEYMDCHNIPFQVGDDVVVKFIGQDQSEPRIIGFLDNPKACGDWSCFWLLVQTRSDGTAFYDYLFYPNSAAAAAKIELAITNRLTVVPEVRWNLGAWESFGAVSGAPYGVWLNNSGAARLEVQNGSFGYGPPPFNKHIELTISSMDTTARSVGDIAEFRLTDGATVLINIAVEYSATTGGSVFNTFVDSGFTYSEWQDVTGRMRSLGGVDASDVYATNDNIVAQLTGYTLVTE